MRPLSLASADNFRDVAGSGYPARHGARVRRGVFYRGGELQLDDEDTLTLLGLGLTGIHDLRTDEEVAAHPDAVIPGATWHQFDVLGIPPDDLAGLQSLEQAETLMRRVYRGFVDDPGARAAFGGLLRALADAEGPQLFHCTTGKDRSGWAAALLLHVAGVADEVVLADYLLSNELARGTRARYLTMVETALGPDAVAVYERVLVADEDYLTTAYAAVAASYGSLGAYLTDGLGLEAAVLERLRQRLTDQRQEEA